MIGKSNGTLPPLPVLPLHDTVIFPLSVVPLAVGQASSVQLVEDAMRADRRFVAVARKTPGTSEAGPDDVHHVGTVTVVHQLMRAGDGSLRLLVQGLQRVRLVDFTQKQPYLAARLLVLPEAEAQGVEQEALARTARDLFLQLLALSPQGAPPELAAALQAMQEPHEIATQIATTAPIATADRQAILELDGVGDRLRRLVELLQHERAVRELQRQVAQETHEEMTKAQRDFLLREQLKTIQRQLGEEDSHQAGVQELRSRLQQANLPDEPKREAERELARLERLPEASPEYGIIRTYLDWMISLPWGRTSGGTIDMARARAVLDEDHYDLERVKDRILEYLAVRKLRAERQAHIPLSGEGEAGHAPAAGPIPQTQSNEARREPILLFVGAPGVGKTSLGQSIARAMNRTFVRMSLGGVHDESEIRGHRRTYIGALPGRIIQAIRRAETSDPVFMLDEIDKLGAGFQGDPAAALLEVLDPAQNSSFVDTYLGVPFDLSRVLFICTANTLEAVPPPLRDRMELIALPGYTEAEKLQIARRYLVPRSVKAHGLVDGELSIEDEALREIIRGHTREAGVRNLERAVASIARKVARRVSEGQSGTVRVRAADLASYLGPPRFFDEIAERIDRPGIATGLAWTPMGGEILFVEATLMPSRGERLILTGMLGDVMRESAQTALSYLRANASRLDLDPKQFERSTVHIHVPAGAIPKDGPSAGVALLVALASLVSGVPVRNDVAMTGEITLRGKVLPVGGIKEKVLAAHQAGVREVILPRRNAADLQEVPEEIRRDIQFVPVDSIEEAITRAVPLHLRHPKVEAELPPPALADAYQ